MANPLEVELHALGAEVSDDQSVALDIGANRSALRLDLAVTAITGSMTVAIETSLDGASGWRQVGAFQLSAADVLSKAFDGCDRYVRASWTVGTSATFQLAGEAHTLFAERRDMSAVAPASMLAKVSREVLVDALIRASADAEDALGATRPLPITKWSRSVTHRVATIAVYNALFHRGFSPEGPDELIVRAHKDAQTWLQRVAEDKLRPPGIEPESAMGPQESSGNPELPDTHRGRMSDNWGDFG